MKHELSMLGLAAALLCVAPANAQNVDQGASSTVYGGVSFTTISGGFNNLVTDDNATISGGTSNRAGNSAGTTTDGANATVSGGYGNYATGNSATIGGGGYSEAGDFATVGGGSTNYATASSATVGGGYVNDATGTSATVSGGYFNSATAATATVGGGYVNDATGTDATVGGGRYNVATNSFATIPGGYDNTASGTFSFAAGRCAKATYEGSFVWNGDANCVSSSAARQFTAKAPGGVRFFSNGAATTGVRLAAGSGSWSSVSDRTLKDNIATVDSEQVLAKLVAMPISTWNYTAQDEGVRHMGPMAQDFAAAFGMGEDERHISTVDAQGVALAAIQGLYKTVQRKDAQIARLEEQTARLQAELQLQREQTVALQQSQTELASTVQAKLDHLEKLAQVAPTYQQAMHSFAPTR